MVIYTVGKVFFLLQLCNVLLIKALKKGSKQNSNQKNIKMEYRDNEVTFNVTSNQLVKGSFTVEDFSITEGQDPKNHIQKGYVASCGNDGKFSFSIGRKGSGSVADWFKGQVSAENTTFNDIPKDLNFAMMGTLELEFSDNKVCKFPNIVLAQGHSGASNNWWFAGKQAVNIGGKKVICGAISGNIVDLVEFERGGNGVSEVGVQPKTFKEAVLS